LFAVEFDGPSHDEPIQEVGDRKKDELGRIFSLPILRINSLYLSPSYRGTELLSWFAECFFLERAFQEAEEEEPCASSELRNSSTALGGFFKLVRWFCAASMTRPGARLRRWRMNSSGCWASMSKGARTSGGKSLRLHVPIKLAPHRIADDDEP
jgi:hypothetical protein